MRAWDLGTVTFRTRATLPIRVANCVAMPITVATTCLGTLSASTKGAMLALPGMMQADVSLLTSTIQAASGWRDYVSEEAIRTVGQQRLLLTKFSKSTGRPRVLVQP
eukprot:TRINITY_DN12641_c0_g1_i3.p6 TRINITY_DN12641_c0_g1~~TRINITY_DN12641_c0_g1_i3.p6  ORF type:complete len:107 (+),score=18.81 TRINITY_DN12641_c0_g1_i3:1196-1516(+)